MQQIFLDTRTLDARARETYGLTEDIMMENAAASLEQVVLSHTGCAEDFHLNRAAVLVLAGSGNNGADGYALARRIASHDIAVIVCAAAAPKSSMCVLQKERAGKAGVRFIAVEELDYFLEEISIDLKVIVDCMFGSGFHGALPVMACAVLEAVNADRDAYKVACDIPTGLDMYGNAEGMVFRADETVTMGALKLALYSDRAKDACGKVTLAGLGISRSAYEGEHSQAQLLEPKDMRLPHRMRQNVHKGSFGHVAAVSGEKSGAAIIAAGASLAFGAGLVTLVSGGTPDRMVPCELMTSGEFPEHTSAVALGMGLGRDNPLAGQYVQWLAGHPEVPCVLDADILYRKEVHALLVQRGSGIVLTPHPKEFAALLEVCGMGTYSVQEVIREKIPLMQRFCEAFPETVLLVKGANVCIGVKKSAEQEVRLYVNPLGTNALAKAGSGDVLSGLTAALLAQQYVPLEAAVAASLAHAQAAGKAECDYSLTPSRLISLVETL